MLGSHQLIKLQLSSVLTNHVKVTNGRVVHCTFFLKGSRKSHVSLKSRLKTLDLHLFSKNPKTSWILCKMSTGILNHKRASISLSTYPPTFRYRYGYRNIYIFLFLIIHIYISIRNIYIFLSVQSQCFCSGRIPLSKPHGSSHY